MSEVRRDQWGRYLVLPPGASKPTGYTRATTVAKALDDGGGLIPWKATATVVGAMRRPGLHARWQALINEHPDPWYDSPESKTACKKLVEECSTAGGSTDRADLGTALHAIIEQSAKQPAGGVPILQPGMQADVDAYHAAIGAAGIVIDPTMVEAMVVLDEYKVAGTSDNLSLYLPSRGNLVADLKTGTDLKYSWQAIAIQLAIYAHSDNVYAQGAAANGSQDQRLPMPELNQEWGLVIHLPAGEARCTLHLVDLVAGWEAFQRSMWTREWRTRKNLAKAFVVDSQLPLTPEFDTPSAPIAACAAAVEGPAGTVGTANATVPAAIEPPDFDGPATTSPTGEPPTTPEQPAVTATGPTGPVARSNEPPDFDTVATSTPTPTVPAVSDSDRAVPPAGPVAPSPQQQHAALATRPDEGGPADTATAQLLEQRYAALDPSSKAWIARFATEAIQQHVSFHMKTEKTIRRFEILRGLVALAGADEHDDEAIRCVLAMQLGAVAHYQALTLGHLIGSLDHRQAAQFAIDADALVNGFLYAAGDDATGLIVFYRSTADRDAAASALTARAA